MQNLLHTVTAFQTPSVPVVPATVIPPLDVAPKALAPLIVRAGEGIYGDQGAYRGYLKLDAESTGNAFILIDLQADKGKGVPPHVHHLEDETFHVLEGRFQIQIGTQVWEAGPGETLFAPRGIAHSWYCISEEPGHLLIIVTPGANFESYLREMAQGQAPMNAMQDSEAVAAFMAMTERYGMTMLPNGIEGTPRLTEAAQKPILNLGDHYGPLCVSSRESGGAFMLGDLDVDFQGGPPPHIHQREDETFIVTKGRFRVMIGDTFSEVGAGDIIFAPRGIRHCWQSITEEGSKVLVLVTPGENFETFASEMARQQVMPPVAPGALENLLALSERHGCQMLPPVW